MKKYADKKVINTQHVPDLQGRVLFVITLEDGTKLALNAREYSELSYYDRYSFTNFGAKSITIEKTGEDEWQIVTPRHEKAEELFQLTKEYNDTKTKLNEIRARYDKAREAYADEYGVTLPDILGAK